MLSSVSYFSPFCGNSMNPLGRVAYDTAAVQRCADSKCDRHRLQIGHFLFDSTAFSVFLPLMLDIR